MDIEIKPTPKPNDTYAHWTVLTGPIKKPKGKTAWFCRCSCGKTREVGQFALMQGTSKSCGCARKEGKPAPVVSELTKARLKARRELQGPPRPKGSITSEETKAKLSASAKARWVKRKEDKEQGDLNK